MTPGAYGEGTGPILLTGVDCIGTEDNLESCRHYMWGHRERGRCYDITLACDGEFQV